MQITISRDPEDNQILAIYARINDGKVRETVEIADGACYVDVDSKGKPLGIEMVAPGCLNISLRNLKSKVDVDSIRGAIKEVKKVVRKLEQFVAA